MSEYALFSWHCACVGLNNDGAGSLQCHWFLTVWELLEVRLLAKLYTQGNHLCHFLHWSSVVRSCLKISSPSNLFCKQNCAFPSCLGMVHRMVHPTTALCHSYNKNTPEVWSCKSRGNPLPWTTPLLQSELCWALIQQMVWRDSLQNHRDKYLIWMSTLKITHFSPQIICVLQKEQRGSSPLTKVISSCWSWVLRIWFKLVDPKSSASGRQVVSQLAFARTEQKWDWVLSGAGCQLCLPSLGSTGSLLWIFKWSQCMLRRADKAGLVSWGKVSGRPITYSGHSVHVLTHLCPFRLACL